MADGGTVPAVSSSNLIASAFNHRMLEGKNKIIYNQRVKLEHVRRQVSFAPPLFKKPSLSPDNRTIQKGQFPQGFRAKAVDWLWPYWPRKRGHFSLYRGFLSKTSEPIDRQFTAFGQEISMGYEGAVF